MSATPSFPGTRQVVPDFASKPVDAIQRATFSGCSESQEVSLNAADYYLTRAVEQRHLSDDHARSAARIYGRYLSFFHQFAGTTLWFRVDLIAASLLPVTSLLFFGHFLLGLRHG